MNVTAPLSVVHLYFTGRSKIHSLFTKLSKEIHDNVARGNEGIVLQGWHKCENEKGLKLTLTALSRVMFQ